MGMRTWKNWEQRRHRCEKLQAKVVELNERLRQQPEDKPLKKAVKKLQKDYLPRLEKYEKQEKTLQNRSIIPN